MKYLCPACTWTGETEKAFPCPACGIGDVDFPLIELKDHLVVTGSNTDAPALLRCGDCRAVHPWQKWLDSDPFESCPDCGSHNAETVEPKDS
jgi:Zn finger protein HypA/HybF involved in hydrogenase expression